MNKMFDDKALHCSEPKNMCPCMQDHNGIERQELSSLLHIYYSNIVGSDV